MTDTALKHAIIAALHDCAQRPLAGATRALLETLGYRSDKRLDLSPNTAAEFQAQFDPQGRLRAANALLADWRAVDLLLQVTGEEIGPVVAAQGALFSNTVVDRINIQSYLFFAVDLTGSHYTRSQLAAATREINRLFPMPALVIFRYGASLTIAIIARRTNQRDAGRDVLAKVTLIKDIRATDPHRAHVDILADLALPNLAARYGVTNFVELQRAWEQTLDTSELNKKFFREVANWYFWAVQNVTFPGPHPQPLSQDGRGETEGYHAVSVIRLITRLIFVWFVKEKGLAPGELFDQKTLQPLLRWNDPKQSTYYKAILQNLFFATLNTEMGAGRCFRGRNPAGQDAHFGIPTVYRYESLFTDPAAALGLFADIPFLNGGLFECLDRPAQGVRVDGFSDRGDNPLAVPDALFFAEPREVDLNAVFDTRNKKYPVRGLLRIFDSYKFTIEENTPIEEEIALDPELLGKVFENLLAAYNPETGASARKQTGSFYTPRPIVEYMVDESLLAYLETALAQDQKSQEPGFSEKPGFSETDFPDRLRHLLAYNQEAHQFGPAEVETLIAAIDRVRILDPACGSGAFPMGVLHKLVFLLGKLDPGNVRWQARQVDKAAEIPDSASREAAIASIEQVFSHNFNDYGRKLYLIENCIYGVDIQPIAVQIAKLRFFISLVVDQRVDDARPNRGIRPLPNLETKFVAANTLLGIARPQQMALRDPAVERKERDLAEVRRRHFAARTQATKEKYRGEDKRLRGELAALLRQDGWGSQTASQLAAWDPYDQNAHADFFDPEWMFGVTEGFDITIGNPPYVRADSGEAHLAFRRQLEASGQYETLWEKWDLYIPFIEIGYKLLKPGGVTTMIVSDAYCHSKYAQKSQTWFLQNSRVLRLDFFSKIQIFDAAVRNITYFFQKADGHENMPERRAHVHEFGRVEILPTSAQGLLTFRAFFPEDEESSNYNNVPTIQLAELCYITVGMVVHADEKVAQGAFELKDLVSHSRDDTHSKPFVEGKHLARWVPAVHIWLEWGTQRAPVLFRRPTFAEIYEVKEKLISVDMSAGVSKLRVVYDDKQLYHNHSAWSFVPWHQLAGVRNNSLKKAARYRDEKPPRPDLPRREELEQTSRRFAVKYLLAVMNSSAARDFLRSNRRSNIHLYPDDWKALPIPDVSLEQQQPLVKLVNAILAAKATNPAADVSALEAEIDRLVYALYGLTPAEIRIVEGG